MSDEELSQTQPGSNVVSRKQWTSSNPGAGLTLHRVKGLMTEALTEALSRDVSTKAAGAGAFNELHARIFSQVASASDAASAKCRGLTRGRPRVSADKAADGSAAAT